MIARKERVLDREVLVQFWLDWFLKPASFAKSHKKRQVFVLT